MEIHSLSGDEQEDVQEGVRLVSVDGVADSTTEFQRTIASVGLPCDVEADMSRAKARGALSQEEVLSILQSGNPGESSDPLRHRPVQDGLENARVGLALA